MEPEPIKRMILKEAMAVRPSKYKITDNGDVFFKTTNANDNTMFIKVGEKWGAIETQGMDIDWNTSFVTNIPDLYKEYGKLNKD